MNCEEIGPLIIAMVHEDLPASEEPAVREHLASCAACRAEAADFKQIRAILREAGRRETAEESRLWARSEATKAKVLALFEGPAAPPGSAPASPPSDAGISGTRCQDVQPLLVAEAYENLLPSEEPTVREHLASCPACRGALEDFRRMRTLLRELGRTEAEHRALLRERADALKPKLEAIFAQPAARPGLAPAPTRPAPPARPAPAPRRRHRVLVLVRAFVTASAIAAAGILGIVAVRFYGSPTRPEPPDRARLLAGPVSVEVEAGGSQFIQVDGTRVEARGAAAFAARLWESREAFEGGADVKTREWVVGSGLILAAFPVLEVTVASGSVSVENEWGRVTGGADEVVFATPHWLPLVKEGDLPAPPAAVLRGMVTGPGEGGPFFADLFEVPREGWFGEPKPMRRAFLQSYGEFSLPVPKEGVYLVLPTSDRDAVLPARGMVLAVGEKGNLGDLEMMARSSFDTDLVLDSIRVDPGASVSVRLELRAAGTVRGSVRDRTGAPCAGAMVEVRPVVLQGGRGRKVVHTDASGRFEAAGILGSFGVDVSGPDWLEGRAEGSVDPGEVTTLDIVVGKTGQLHGTVVDPDGRPVAGAKVTIHTERQWKMVGYWVHEPGGHSPDATTGPDGAFRIEVLRLRPEPYTVHATAGPLRAGLVQGIDPFSIPPEGVRIVLQPTQEIRGRVLDSDGRPVGAIVTLNRVGEPVSAPGPRAESGSDGTFRFVNLPEGEFDLRAMAMGHAQSSVRARSGDVGVEIRLATTGWILRGRVLLPSGMSHPVVLGPGTAPSWRRLRTDNALRLVLLRRDPRSAEGPIPREDEVVSRKVPLEDPRTWIEVPHGSPRLWLALMVCGRMVDAREASAEEILFDYDLEAVVPQVGGLRILALDASKGDPISTFEVSLCADGRGPWWTAPGIPGDVVGPLLPGRYTALVSAEGYEPATLENLAVEAGKAGETIEVRLRRR
jgi:anti-sigma factor RsiW